MPNAKNAPARCVSPSVLVGLSPVCAICCGYYPPPPCTRPRAVTALGIYIFIRIFLSLSLAVLSLPFFHASSLFSNIHILIPLSLPPRHSQQYQYFYFYFFSMDRRSTLIFQVFILPKLFISNFENSVA
jgi:hypothetical protein